MILDVHTHTDRYSPCSTISLEELISAERRKVDGIAVTDHDHLLSEREAEYLSGKYDFTVLPGVEISAEGIYAHILAFGIEREIRPGLGVEETIAKIHEQGGVAVAAHPLRYVDELDRRKWRGIDCIETLTPNCSLRQNMRAREIASDWRFPQIGSSDAHSPFTVGTYATLFNNNIANVDQLKKDLLKGEAEPITLWTHPRRRGV
ncbi:MAG: PHP-associated domain-containing protein [Candidatus Bathyarchaeia archaeon]